MFANKNFVDILTRSQIYQDYERAFNDATGLAVSLRPVESWQLPHRGRKNENPFCAMMAQQSGSCAACLRVREQLTQQARTEPKTITCFAGMSDTAVPVRIGENLIGFLETGQVFRHKPTEAQFNRTAKRIEQLGTDVRTGELRKAYFATPVLSPRRHAGVVTLLRIFAQQLSTMSNHVLVRQQNAEPPMIVRAKDFISRNIGEHISLGQVAKAVNTSTFYFCKMFKRYTALNFTDYVSRIRIEKAKNLLLNPNLRVSEIAFEVGFQSLTHFNRVFKRIAGESPSGYRGEIATA
ncbi:MAG: helix-turn-helix domain-containing protein [Chthoniobacteraceae bacterium]|jgi:AraC-like DNA-binding protein